MLLVIGVLAGIAMPRFFAVTAEAEVAAILTTVNRVFDAAERFAAEHGRLPDDEYAGVVPAELLDYLPATMLDQDTSFGSKPDWNGPGTTAPVYGVDFRVTDWNGAATRLYDLLESKADDGASDTGWITASKRRAFFELTER